MMSYAIVAMLAALSAAQNGLKDRDEKLGIEFNVENGDASAVISDNWVGKLRVTDTRISGNLSNTLMSTVTLKEDFSDKHEVQTYFCHENDCTLWLYQYGKASLYKCT